MIDQYPVLIGLHRAPGFISRLIRWQQRGDYSHASLYFHGLGVIEAREFRGVQHFSRYQPRDGETIDLFSVPISPAVAKDVQEFAAHQLGKPYDYTMVARFISRRQESRRSSGKWFCSELVYAAFRHAGVNLLRATEPWEVSPGLLGRSPLLQYVTKIEK